MSRTGKPTGRPPLPPTRKRIQIALKIDPRVLAKLKAQAMADGVGYQTLINALLAKAARRIQAPAGPSLPLADF